MEVKAHPSDDRLMAYADGSLSDGLALLVASHLTYCPRCRTAVERMELLGGAMIADQAPAGIAAPDRGRVLARLAEEEAPEPTPPVAHDRILPAPLRQVLGTGVDAIRWRFLLPGLSEHRIEGFEGEDVSLLRARPGTRILAHTHEGEESTLVLCGQLKDGDAVYRRGDVAAADAADDHRPEIVGDEVCICLIVLSGRMRFTGSFGRALNFFTH